ncbi:MAG: glycosyl hydrolase family protein [Mesorhizobium sp.]|nr:MAG: glycosyl hydrolase family protein [Mesorhizobium sp.]
MSDALEIWGGVECSHVHIGATVRDQLKETGHFHRIDDLDLISELGIRTLRYPVLWETVESERGRYDWSWTDARLQRIRQLGMRPIAGLLHHGSGPSWSQIVDPDFPEMFARYAALVAQRYPWIDLYTPINEPLTTARISGLYGVWHPHGTSEATCLQLTVAQCRATSLAMKAIRAHAPAARLVQTEDFGRIFSTERLAYQASHENERRWLALDLLAGRVDRRHPFYERLLDAGVAVEHLSHLAVEPCPPDVIGLDYYLTSDRMLDENVDRYPDEQVGGNGIDTYVDSAAVRPVGRHDTGLRQRIDEVWNRYHLPIAVTELHNGSTRDEQVRWLVEGWQAAQAARESGADVRAVTAWSLFGAVDWNSMLSAKCGYYECGAFDVRGGTPRPTALSSAIASLAEHGRFDHPVMDRPGWWRQEPCLAGTSKRPLLLIGSGLTLAAIEACCSARRLSVLTVNASQTWQMMKATAAWATVGVDEPSGVHSGAVRLHCRYPEGQDFLLQCNHVNAPREVANAFLDLIIDGQRGAFALSRSEPANQYEFSALASARYDVHDGQALSDVA